MPIPSLPSTAASRRSARPRTSIPTSPIASIDANGCAVAPGLIDSHCHPVFGDWTPRQNQLGWIESCVNGGVTTFVSAGEVHLPGRPKDPIGVKALAITAQRTFANFRPSGAKVMAGAPIAEKTMVEEDYAEMARAGVTHDRRDRARHRQHRAGSQEACRLVPQARAADHHPHRRSVDSGLQPDQPRGGAGSQPRRHQPHQRRPHGAGHRATSASCASRPRAPSRSCTTATRRPPSPRSRRRWS